MSENPVDLFKSAVYGGNPDKLRDVLVAHPELKERLNDPLFHFDAPGLNIAASRGNREMADALLDAGADINARSKWWAGSWGVLDFAAPELARYLIERGAHVDIHAAAHLGMIERVRELVKEDPQLVHARGGDGTTPLHFAATIEVADFLLDHDADIHARDVDHVSTPVQWLAKLHPEVCRHLVGRGGEMDIFLAISLGDIEWIRTALKRDSSLLESRIGREPYTSPGSDGGHIYTFKMGGANATPLHAAASLDQPEIAALLVEAGLDVNTPGAYDDCAPLHLAAFSNHTKTAETLITSGADIERESGPFHKNTPLGWAIVAGSADAVKVLLDHKAKLRDYYLSDAKKGEEGAFRDISRQPAAAYKTIAGFLMERGAV